MTTQAANGLDLTKLNDDELNSKFAHLPMALQGRLKQVRDLITACKEVIDRWQKGQIVNVNDLTRRIPRGPSGWVAGEDDQPTIAQRVANSRVYGFADFQRECFGRTPGSVVHLPFETTSYDVTTTLAVEMAWYYNGLMELQKEGARIISMPPVSIPPGLLPDVGSLDTRSRGVLTGWMPYFRVYQQNGKKTHIILGNRSVGPCMPPPYHPDPVECHDLLLGLSEECSIPQWFRREVIYRAFIPSLYHRPLRSTSEPDMWYYQTHSEADLDIAWYRISNWLADFNPVASGLWMLGEQLRRSVATGSNIARADWDYAIARRVSVDSISFEEMKLWDDMEHVRDTVLLAGDFLRNGRGTSLEIRIALADFQRSLLDLRGWRLYCDALGQGTELVPKSGSSEVDVQRVLEKYRGVFVRGVFTGSQAVADQHLAYNIPVWLVIPFTRPVWDELCKKEALGTAKYMRRLDYSGLCPECGPVDFTPRREPIPAVPPYRQFLGQETENRATWRERPEQLQQQFAMIGKDEVSPMDIGDPWLDHDAMDEEPSIPAAPTTDALEDGEVSAPSAEQESICARAPDGATRSCGSPPAPDPELPQDDAPAPAAPAPADGAMPMDGGLADATQSANVSGPAPDVEISTGLEPRQDVTLRAHSADLVSICALAPDATTTSCAPAAPASAPPAPASAPAAPAPAPAPAPHDAQMPMDRGLDDTTQSANVSGPAPDVEMATELDAATTTSASPGAPAPTSDGALTPMDEDGPTSNQSALARDVEMATKLQQYEDSARSTTQVDWAITTDNAQDGATREESLRRGVSPSARNDFRAAILCYGSSDEEESAPSASAGSGTVGGGAGGSYVAHLAKESAKRKAAVKDIEPPSKRKRHYKTEQARDGAGVLHEGAPANMHLVGEGADRPLRWERGPAWLPGPPYRLLKQLEGTDLSVERQVLATSGAHAVVPPSLFDTGNDGRCSLPPLSFFLRAYIGDDEHGRTTEEMAVLGLFRWLLLRPYLLRMIVTQNTKQLVLLTRKQWLRVLKDKDGFSDWKQIVEALGLSVYDYSEPDRTTGDGPAGGELKGQMQETADAAHTSAILTEFKRLSDFINIETSLANFNGFALEPYSEGCTTWLSDNWRAYIIGELAEMEFRHKLFQVDHLIRLSHPEVEALNRDPVGKRFNIVAACWGGGGLTVDVDDENWLVSKDWAKRSTAIRRFADLIREWPGANGVPDAQTVARVTSQPSSSAENGEFLEVEALTWKAYMQVFWDYTRARPVLPFDPVDFPGSQ